MKLYEKIQHAKGNQKKIGIATLKLENKTLKQEILLEIKNIFHKDKRSIQQEDIIILNFYAC